MVYREGDRQQMALLPPVIDDYVGAEDPVRAYDAIIETMDTRDLELVIDSKKVGNPAYDPKSMLKLLVYGYSYGWRSSRKLERALHHNLSFIWLMGGLTPDHKTISKFRKDNHAALQTVMKQCARICLKLDLIEGNCLFTDGTKIRGNAGISQTKTREKWEQNLDAVDRRIAELLAECDEADETETGSLVEARKELKDKQKLRRKIESLLDQMKQEDLKKINGTDTDCVNFKGRQGSHAGYNTQITVDEKNGLIISADVVKESNDTDQFSNQIAQAIDILGAPCKTAVADAGYANVDNLKETVDKGIDVIVPSQKQSLHTLYDDPFGKDKFRYDPQNNQYICPEGKKLRYSHYSIKKGHYLYRMEKPSLCLECPHFGVCTASKRGRAMIRLKNEELKEQLETRYESETGQAIYKKRKEKAEAPFGHIKRNLNGGAFLVRGLQAVKAEFSILAGCFNIARMITLMGGVSVLINRLMLLNAQSQ